MEMFTEIVRVLMFVIIGGLPLLVHFSCRAVQIFFFDVTKAQLIVQYPTFFVSSATIAKISIIAPDAL